MCVESAAGHHLLHVPQRPQIVQRVLSRYDEVGALSGGDRPGHIAKPGQLRTAARGRVERESVRYADELVEIIKLPPEIILRDPRAADVVAQHDGNVVRQRGLCALDDALKDNIAIELFHLRRVTDRPVEQRVGQRGGDCRAEECAALAEQPENLIIRFCAVLDRVKTE